MWRTALIVVALLVVLPLAGLIAGFAIGEALCDDPRYQTYPDFRCADEDALGGGAGFMIGLLIAIILAVALRRRHRRTRQLEDVEAG
jgi:hypothetical protein